MRAAVAALLFTAVQARADVQYAYDPAGRLVQVVAVDGSSAVYQYDAAGNTTAVLNLPPGQLAFVSPNASGGGPGTQITIYGSGFSTNCSADAVSFGGVGATVISCTANQLVVQVPTGASTGQIAVTVGGQTVSGSQPFVVPAAPTISGFSPAIATIGGTVTVSGTNLNPQSGATRAAVGGTGVRTTSIASTQVGFVAQGSGAITVTTLYGRASSATNLVTVPASIGAANVLASAVLTENGGSQSITIAQAGKYGLFSFDATLGQFVSIQVNALTTIPSGGSVSYQIYAPNSTLILSSSVSATSPSIHLPQLAQSGTYLAVFSSGSATSVQVGAAVEVNSTLSAGTTLPVATSVPGQTKRFIFTAVAGQNLALALTNMALAPTGPQTYIYPYVYKPDGGLLVDPNCYTTNPGPSCNVTMYNLPQTGTYTVRIDSPPQQGMSFNLLISQAVTATLVMGTPLTVGVTTPGQFAVVNFNLPTTQTVALQFSSATTTPANQNIWVGVNNSAGTQVTSYNSNGSSTSSTYNLTNLPAGVYTLVVIPANAATGSLQMNVAPGVSGTFPVDGTTYTSVSTNLPGQSAYFSFTGTAGQNVAMALMNMALTPTGPQNYIYPYVYKPDGGMLVDPNCYTTNPGPSCNVTMYNLPQTGTYTVRIDSPPQQKMSFNVLMSQAVTATLTMGTPLTVGVTIPGQFAVVTFTLPTTQTVALEFGSATTAPANQNIWVGVNNSAGAQVTSYNSNGSSTSSTYNLTNLPAGTYTLIMIPANAATGSLQLNVAPGVSGTFPVDGTTNTSVSTNLPGQSAYFSFPGTAGQNVAMALTNMALTPTGPQNYIYPYVYKPDGGMLVDPNCYTTNPGPSCNVTMYNLPQTGTYTVRIDSPPQQKMSFNVLMSQAVTATLVMGTPLTVGVTVPGQFAVVNFTLPTTQTVGLEFNSATTTPANQNIWVGVNNSAGTQVTSYNSNGSSAGTTYNLTNLPAGTYELIVIPANAATGSLQLNVAPGVSGALPVDGATVTNVSPALPGMSAYYSFSGTAGQSVAMALTNMSLTPTGPQNYIYPYVYKPDGGMLVDPNCYTTNPGAACNVTMYNLPQTGTYTVRIDSPPQQKMSLNLVMSQALTASLTKGTPLSLSLPIAGQFAVVSFTATAGQAVTFGLGSVATTPTGQSVWTGVFNPSGVQVTSLNTSGTSTTANLTNLVAGQYALVVIPNYAATATAQISAQ